MSRVLALVACVALASGCFGYTPSAKKWAYVGDAILIVGGGGAIAADLLTHEPCQGVHCSFDPPFSGATVAGVLLVSAGIIGIVINATRDEVKTSR
jgi:ABC-type Mn2+/Zn2+ transport system permease subunit